MQLQPKPWKRGEAGDREVTKPGGATIATEQDSCTQCSNLCVSTAYLIPAGPWGVPLAFQPVAEKGPRWVQTGDGAQCGVGGGVAEQRQILMLLGLFSMSLDQKVLSSETQRRLCQSASTGY